MSNDDLAGIVETSDEWIRDRTGIRERRIAAPAEAMSDLAFPPRPVRSPTQAWTPPRST